MIRGALPQFNVSTTDSTHFTEHGIRVSAAAVERVVDRRDQLVDADALVAVAVERRAIREDRAGDADALTSSETATMRSPAVRRTRRPSSP
jgi:hypothetical protein